MELGDREGRREEIESLFLENLKNWNVRKYDKKMNTKAVRRAVAENDAYMYEINVENPRH